MECPFCHRPIVETWRPLLGSGRNVRSKMERSFFRSGEIIAEIRASDREADEVGVRVESMKCPNDDCCQVLVKITRREIKCQLVDQGFFRPQWQPVPEGTKEESWMAVPKRKSVPRIDPSIPERFRKDYSEAHLILNDCPRMSAVLSRSILADLLKDYAGLDDCKLSKRIESFIKDSSHPSPRKQDLHHLREIGNRGAHTQTDELQLPINVTSEEAEWTLKIVRDLFDYFIVSPENDKKMRQSVDEKIKKAGRKEIKPLRDAESRDV